MSPPLLMSLVGLDDLADDGMLSPGGLSLESKRRLRPAF